MRAVGEAGATMFRGGLPCSSKTVVRLEREGSEMQLALERESGILMDSSSSLLRQLHRGTGAMISKDVWRQKESQTAGHYVLV